MSRVSESYINYDISDNVVQNASGTNQQFLDIFTDPSFSSVTVPIGRTGRRFDNVNSTLKRRINISTDISLNYQDPSWNFHIALDTSRNYLQGYVWEMIGGIPTQRDAIVHIFDISYRLYCELQRYKHDFFCQKNIGH